MDRLPRMTALTARVPPSDQPAWLADAVLASRMQFLMYVLTACVAAAPEVRNYKCAAAMCSRHLHPVCSQERNVLRLIFLSRCRMRLQAWFDLQEIMQKAAPSALLYLQHPSIAAASAAHGLVCALVQALEPQQRGSLATAYLERALPGYPATCPSASLAVGVDTLAHALPAGSGDAAAMAIRLAERVDSLIQQPATHAVRCQPPCTDH